MIESYYNDRSEITLKKRGNLVDGKYQYGEEEKLECFVRYNNEVIRDKHNTQVISTAKYSTNTEIKVDDMIENKIVKMVTRPRGYEYQYYRAYV